MRGITSWNHTPYTLLHARQRDREFFVCQILPGHESFAFAFRDAVESAHTLLWKVRGEENWNEMPLSGMKGEVKNLSESTDYAFCVRREQDGETTRIRLVRPGKPDGVIVNYLHPEDEIYAFSGRYLCSPSILQLPSGRMLAGMDLYGPKMAQNLTLIFESLDGGESWEYVTELYPCFWGELFYHQGKVYMMGMACEYGDLLIGVSEDEGHTWQPPVRIFPGSNANEIGPHKAPMPVLNKDGYLYTAIDYGCWKYGGHANCILSIKEEEDLLNPANWRLTFPWEFESDHPGMPEGELRKCLEGNAVDAPDGSIVNMLRLQQDRANPNVGHAVILKMQDQDEALVFDKVVEFPLGANSKFVVFREGEWYVAVGNEWFDPAQPKARSILSAAISKDLVNWEVAERIIDERQQDANAVAFQYPDAQMAGDDLIVLSRTAWNGANNYHNANMITFHRVKDFAKKLQK